MDTFSRYGYTHVLRGSTPPGLGPQLDGAQLSRFTGFRLVGSGPTRTHPVAAIRLPEAVGIMKIATIASITTTL